MITELQKLAWKTFAEDNVNRYLSDAVSEADPEMWEDPEFIAENMYTLAFDGAVDAGATDELAREIAQEISGRRG